MTFDELEQSLGIQFTNKDLLHQAFFHRSYLNENRAVKESNERLEFLGDAILSFLTSKYLYRTYPEYPEGTLTNIRSSLVKTKSLADAAYSLGFGDLLFLSHGEEDSGGRKNPSLLADCFEAFLGAMFLDSNADRVNMFLEKVLFPKTAAIIAEKSYVDFKSLLQEVIQEESRISPTYKVTKTEGPDHNRTFWIDAMVTDKTVGSGSGHSKQEAEQDAAHNALEKMGKI